MPGGYASVGDEDKDSVRNEGITDNYADDTLPLVAESSARNDRRSPVLDLGSLDFTEHSASSHDHGKYVSLLLFH